MVGWGGKGCCVLVSGAAPSCGHFPPMPPTPAAVLAHLQTDFLGGAHLQLRDVKWKLLSLPIQGFPASPAAQR